MRRRSMIIACSAGGCQMHEDAAVDLLVRVSPFEIAQAASEIGRSENQISVDGTASDKIVKRCIGASESFAAQTGYRRCDSTKASSWYVLCLDPRSRGESIQILESLLQNT